MSVSPLIVHRSPLSEFTMSEKKKCNHCGRSIDATARVCPYCNREQGLERPADSRPVTVPLPPIEPAPLARASSTKKGPSAWSTRALLIAAAVALLVASFAVGGLVYGLSRRGETVSAGERPPQIAENVARGDREFPQLILVPEADPTATIGRSITSAPIPDPDHKMPVEFQRTDATALPSEEYAKIIEQSHKPQTAATQSASVDPRTVTATQSPPPPLQETTTLPPWHPESIRPDRVAQPPDGLAPREQSRPERIEPRPQRLVRTNPVPIHQPLPRVKDREEEIEASGTMRFRLTVGADGRVREIRVLETMPGMTGKMIAAIQKWRFKPATENGVPVEGTFMVDISFKAPE